VAKVRKELVKGLNFLYLFCGDGNASAGGSKESNAPKALGYCTRTTKISESITKKLFLRPINGETLLICIGLKNSNGLHGSYLVINTSRKLGRILYTGKLSFHGFILLNF